MIAELRYRQVWQNPLAQLRTRRQAQKAVANAYGRFAARYPQWTEALFDAHFVARHMTSLVAQREMAGGLLEPQDLAEAWAQQLLYPDQEMRGRHMNEMVNAAAEFLRLVDEALAR